MKSSQIDRIAVSLTQFVLRRRLAVILLVLAMAAAAGFGGKNLVFSNNYRTFFSKENPDLINFDHFQATYSKNDNILFVVRPSQGDIFTNEITAMIEELTERAWQIPYTSRVDSLTNFQHSWAEGDELTVDDLVRDAAGLGPEGLKEKKAIALNEPLLRDLLVSADGKTAGVNVTLQYPEASIAEVPEAVGAARAIAAEMSQQHPNVEIALSGLSMLNNAFAESGMQDAMTLVPFMYLLLIAAMVMILRSIWATVATLTVIGIATVVAMGLAGYLGIELSPISVTAPTIILTLAIADCIHIIMSMMVEMGEGKDKRDALVESMRINMIPVTITSLTTALGFLTLNFSDAPPFWDLGNMTAIGITAAWLVSLAFLPALLSYLPIKAPKRRGSFKLGARLLERLASFVTTRYKGLILGLGGVLAVLLAFVPRLELNDEWIKYFDSRLQFRRDADFHIANLGGLYQMEFSLEAGEAGGISNPEYLEHLERFTQWLRGQNEVRHVFSYTDIIRRLNKNMHGDNLAFYSIPQERNLAAQYLLLYELSLPFGLDLNDRINVDKSATRVTATLDDIATVEQRAFMVKAKSWLQTHTPEFMHADPTGATVMFSFISKRNIESMLSGNALALLLIGVVLMLVLRSVAIGLLSLLLNGLPILATFGLWSLLVGQVGMAAATVTATSLGIVVDDTVHLLTKYLRARREQGLGPAEAIHYAFRLVGPAIIATTAILSLGFAALATSTFLINAQMGLLTALAIVVALVFDLLLLPAFLMIGEKKGTSYETDLEPQMA